MRSLAAIVLLVVAQVVAQDPALASTWRCAGLTPGGGPAAAYPLPSAKPLAHGVNGGRAVVLFGGFRGEHEVGTSAPAWADDLFDPDLPGSVTHFYRTMSFGRLHLGGEAAPQRYTSPGQASDYLKNGSGSSRFGGYGAFTLEVLEQADRDIDFSRYDSDGPDGVPDSGDDDGVVDAVFLVLSSTPPGFILSNASATGIAGLGFSGDFVTDDPGANGAPIRISPASGTLQQGKSFAETVGSICHEYGHVLGLPDLYGIDFLELEDPHPEQDSAGIGRWGLMGWGALGWEGGGGPASMSAWSREQLGWAHVTEPGSSHETMELQDVGRGGGIYRISLSRNEYFLVEYRTRSSSHYDRQIPGEGLLIWHVERTSGSESARKWLVDLECADGRWRDAGYPHGTIPDATHGGDNLDFWAHDASYRDRHGGNLGDATDPFDGVSNTAFTAQTNPSSRGSRGSAVAHLERIILSEGVARAEVKIRAPELELTSAVPGAYGVVAGGVVPVPFAAANLGGLPLTDLVLLVRSEDPLVEVIDGVVELADLDVGEKAVGNRLSGGGFPRVRIHRAFELEHSTSVILEASAHGEVLSTTTIELLAVPGYLISGQVRDVEGVQLEGIPVEAARLSASGVGAGYHYRERVPTDAEGRYELYVPEGLYTVSARPAPSTGFGLATQAAAFIADDMSLDFAIAKLHLVRGLVWDPAGGPLASLRITATATDRVYSDFARSGSDGAYQLELVPGTYVLGTSSRRSPRGIPEQVLAEIDVRGDVALDLYPRRSARLTMQVVDEEGRGVPGVHLVLASASLAAGLSTLTGDGGLGVLQVTSGAYSIDIEQAPLPFLPVEAIGVDVVGDTAVQVVLRLGILVTGRVIDEAGAPVASDESSLEFALVDAGSGSSHRTPLQDESFSLGLAPGLYRVHYEGDEMYPPQALGTLRMAQDMQVDFVLRKEPLATTAVTVDDVLQPHTYGLAQNYPNPFNSETTIVYQLPQEGDARLSVYSATGQLVRRLVSGRQQSGEHRVVWQGCDDAGVAVASGVYVYVMEAGGRQEIRRLLLLR